MAFADVKIFEFHVHPGKVEGSTAHVPNVLSSQDRFVNQLGLTEYELYTLLKEDGAWKIDSQVIVEPKDVSKWFPKADAGRGPSHRHLERGSVRRPSTGRCSCAPGRGHLPHW